MRTISRAQLFKHFYIEICYFVGDSPIDYAALILLQSGLIILLHNFQWFTFMLSISFLNF